MEEKKFRYSIRSLQSTLYSFALMLTGDRDNAYYLVQDTKAMALERRSECVGIDDLKGWTLKLMRDIFIKHYVDSGRSMCNADNTVGTEFELRNVIRPESCMDTSALSRRFRHLPDNLRVPMIMHSKGYRYNEIAKKLGMAVDDVRECICRADQELRTTQRASVSA